MTEHFELMDADDRRRVETWGMKPPATQAEPPPKIGPGAGAAAAGCICGPG